MTERDETVRGDGWTRREVMRAAVAAGSLAALGAGPEAVASTVGEPLPAGAGLPHPTPGTRPRVVVIGAGAFGGWTALHLHRMGARVTLVDAWGAGNARASSGGESRVIRGMYGPDRVYTEWVVRSFELWREADERWGQRLYHPTGALWMFRGDDGYARASLPTLASFGLPAERLDPAEAGHRFPGIDMTGVRHAYYEPEAGYLVANRACRTVARAVATEGGEVVTAAARPGRVEATERGGAMRSVRLSNGRELRADAFVFACGPWLGEIFPEVIGRRVLPTRQDVFFFGVPEGEPRFGDDRFPVWVDFGNAGERIFYGIPGNESRGFKVADDTHGEPVDPTSLDRSADPESLARARALLAERFPALADAPLLGSRVCQYESTPDGHYLIDRHPAAENVWLLGGGSGHGFKLGPALGERMATWVLGREEPLPRFALARLDEPADHPERGRSQLESGDGT
jgi:glycine/D-amino acid oxidase-like deaminating enzyme